MSRPTASESPPDARRWLRLRDRLLSGVLRTAGSICAGVMVLVIVFLWGESWPAWRDVGLVPLLTAPQWHPAEFQFGLLSMLLGTFAATLGAFAVTTPLGIGSAIFLRFYAPAFLASVYRRVLEVLAGIPSVIWGLWGISELVPLIAEVSPLGQGQSLLAGVLVLSMMTLPTVALATEAALRAVPEEYEQAAAALGVGPRTMAWSIALPAAREGILVGIVLQTVRALGETMAVLMVCGNIVQTPRSLFAPIRTLTANIALEVGYADARHRAVLFASGAIMLSLVIGLVLLVEAVRSRGAPRLPKRPLPAASADQPGRRKSDRPAAHEPTVDSTEERT